MRRADRSKTRARIWRVEGGKGEARSDQLATEEPLEIRLRWAGERRTVAVTMRTPGADAELAVGFLFAEGVIDSRARVRRVAPCAEPAEEGSSCENVVEVELADGPPPPLQTLERHFFATSACGVCGKAGLETLRLRATAAIPPGPRLEPALLAALPARLRREQGLFEATGGLHAAALFDAAGTLLAVREDVGRHNALDKLFGRALLDGRLPLHDHVVLVSGRSSYEILQKCLVAGVPVVCAVSAPSSLAVDLASAFGITLVGFLRGDRFNVYSGAERIAATEPEPSLGRGRGSREGLLPTLL
jgi:FdhD protein